MTSHVLMATAWGQVLCAPNAGCHAPTWTAGTKKKIAIITMKRRRTIMLMFELTTPLTNKKPVSVYTTPEGIKKYKYIFFDDTLKTKKSLNRLLKNIGGKNESRR